MLTSISHITRHVRLFAAIAVVMASLLSVHAHDAASKAAAHVAADTLRHTVNSLEMSSMQQRMMSSAMPVTITQQGRRLCVYSRYNQLLPVYRANGMFYQAFRLSKGTTWINGLPRGKYIINGRQYTIY